MRTETPRGEKLKLENNSVKKSNSREKIGNYANGNPEGRGIETQTRLSCLIRKTILSNRPKPRERINRKNRNIQTGKNLNTRYSEQSETI